MGCTSSLAVLRAVVPKDDPAGLANVAGSLEPPPGPKPLDQGPDAAVSPVVPEIFQFSDFRVGVSPSRSYGCLGRSRTRRNKRSAEAFVFGDLELELEQQLEDRIVAEYRCGKLQAEFHIPGGYRFPDVGTPLEPSHQVLRRYQVHSLLGHPARVKCIAVHPNERSFVSCAHDDSAISLYDLRTGRELVSYFGHEDVVLNAAFSTDGKYLATCSRDRTMILWDVTTGKQLFTFEHDKVVICCAFAYDGRFLASGCQDGVCRVWDVKKRREVVAFPDHDGIVVAIAACPTDVTVASAATDRTVRLWNGATGQVQRTLRGHQGLILACSWHADGAMLVSTEEAVVRLWDAVAGVCIRTVDVRQVCAGPTGPGRPRAVAWALAAFGPGCFCDYVLAVSSDRTLHVLELEGGQEVLTVGTRAPVYCLSAGPERTLAFGDAFGNVYVMELA
eukprot:EG_transcript_6900